MSSPVGLTVPKLLPISGTFAPLFAGYYGLLLVRVSLARQKLDHHFGVPAPPTNPAAEPDELSIAARSHANFSENVPFALLLGAIVELNGGNRKVLTGGLSALLLFRILHVEFGMRAAKQLGSGRVVGHTGTFFWILGAGGYAAYLVKGYWGF